jgi:hypothetical protein
MFVFVRLVGRDITILYMRKLRFRIFDTSLIPLKSEISSYLLNNFFQYSMYIRSERAGHIRERGECREIRERVRQGEKEMKLKERI